MSIKEDNRHAGGWLISLILHALLAFLFLNIVINNEIEDTDYAIMTFSSYVQQEEIKVAQQPSTSSIPASRQSSGNTLSRTNVDIPVRRMTDRNPNKIPAEQRDKLTDVSNVRTQIQRPDPLSGVSRTSSSRQNNSLTGVQRLRGSTKLDAGSKLSSQVPTEGIGGSSLSEKPYEIKWEGGGRDILSSPLPEYPEGIFKEVVLVMSINVLPDGTVGSIIITKKGDATLENVTIESLKLWRFNPLEPSAPQINQQAQVTFRFNLK